MSETPVLSKIKLNNIEYEIKDSTARESIPEAETDLDVESMLDTYFDNLVEAGELPNAVMTEINKKLDKDFGSQNAGKFLVIGSNGIPVATTLPLYNGGVI